MGKADIVVIVVYFIMRLLYIWFLFKNKKYMDRTDFIIALTAHYQQVLSALLLMFILREGVLGQFFSH